MLPPSMRVFIATQPVNMNRSFDGLVAMVEREMDVEVSPFSGHLFVFRNRRRDKVKLLFWDRGGFWIFYKRLEKGTFRLPTREGRHLEIEAVDLALLLEGIELAGSRRRPRWMPPAGRASRR